MRALIQRVTYGSVTVADQVVGQIDHGLVVLIGVTHTDTPAIAERLAEKTVHLRIFEDAEGRLNRSVLDTNGGVLIVPQFTLYASLKGSRRPDFMAAARPEAAQPLYEHYVAQVRSLGVAHVATGVFRAMMQVVIHNDGPVTIWLDTETF